MKKCILNLDYFENRLYMESKYDTSPRSYGNIEIDEKDRDNFIAEQIERFTSTLVGTLKCVNTLSFEEFAKLYGKDDNGNAICPNCGSIIHKDDWDYENRCWFCGFMNYEENS